MILTREDFEKRIEELCKLKPGWFEGTGGTYKKEDFENIKEKLYSFNIPIPYLFPNIESNIIILEWSIFGFDYRVYLNIISNEFECFSDLSTGFPFHPFGDYKEGIFDLNKDWNIFVNNFETFRKEAEHLKNKWVEKFGSGEPKPKSIKSILKTIWRKIKGGK
jgi:hypothetical protein